MRYKMNQANRVFQQKAPKKSALDIYTFILTHASIYSKIAHYLISYRFYHWRPTTEYKSVSDTKGRIKDEKEEDLRCIDLFRSNILNKIELDIKNIEGFDKQKSDKLLKICAEAMTCLVEDQEINNKWIINFIIDFFNHETVFDILGPIGIMGRLVTDKYFIKAEYYHKKIGKHNDQYKNLKKELWDEIQVEGSSKYEFIRENLQVRWGFFPFHVPVITGLLLDYILFFLVFYALFSIIKLDNNFLCLTYFIGITLSALAKGVLIAHSSASGSSLSKLNPILKAETLKEIAEALAKVKNAGVLLISESEHTTSKKTNKQSSSVKDKQNHPEGFFEVKKWGGDYEPASVKNKTKTRGTPQIEEANYLSLILNEEKLPLPLKIVWQSESGIYEYNLGTPDIVKIWSNNWVRKTAIKDDFAVIAMAIFEELAEDHRLANKFYGVAQWGHAVAKQGSTGYVKTANDIIKLKILTELFRLVSNPWKVNLFIVLRVMKAQDYLFP